MNQTRLDKLIKLASDLLEAKKATDPRHAPWMKKAGRGYNDAVDRLNAQKKRVQSTEETAMQWNEDMVDQLEAVLNDHWGWIDASVRLCGQPEPQSQIRWFGIFPDWFALIPIDLQMPALQEMQKETRHNWLNKWLLHLSWGKLTIPAGLKQESMGTIIRTVIDNADAFDCFLTYCKKCALLYPKRKHELSSVLPACPHCGEVEYVYAHAVA